jgi:IS5 family transposase
MTARCGTSFCTARRRRSGRSCHWRAIGPSDNGDGYVSAAREAAFAGPGKFWGVMRKAPKGGRLDPIEADINRLIARVRARVEHPFRVIKRPFGYLKTRYRGLAKNRAQLFTLFALGNLFLMRRRLAA